MREFLKPDQRRVLFYVNEHGSGHAVRAARVIRRLAKLRPEVSIIVNSAKNRDVFSGVERVSFRDNPAQIAADIREFSPFEVDDAGSAASLLEFHQRREEIAQTERAWVESNGIDLMVCDIPWLPGVVAARSKDGRKIPCIGIANFLWDWIAEPMLSGRAGGGDVLRAIEEDYAQMDAILKMPFSHEMADLANVREVNLLDAEVSPRSEEEILKSMGAPNDGRLKAHVSMRQDVLGANLEAFIEGNRDFVFIQAGGEKRRLSDNHYEVKEGELLYPELFKVCDIMIGKAGYGMMTACAANQTALLCVERTGFREDEVLLPQGAELFPLRQISYEDFTQGRWAEGLEVLAKASAPQKSLPLGGADDCARFISERISPG